MEWKCSEFRESDKSIKYELRCSCCLIQEVAVSDPFTVMTNILVTEIGEFYENIKGKLKCMALFPKIVTTVKEY